LIVVFGPLVNHLNARRDYDDSVNLAFFKKLLSQNAACYRFSGSGGSVDQEVTILCINDEPLESLI